MSEVLHENRRRCRRALPVEYQGRTQDTMLFAWARIPLSKDVAFKACERVTSIVCPR
jgi:hypothetical protein